MSHDLFIFLICSSCIIICYTVFKAIAPNKSAVVKKVSLRMNNRLSSLRIFMVFLTPPRQMMERCRKISHARFHPLSFQLVIRQWSFHSTLCILRYWHKARQLEIVLIRLKYSASHGRTPFLHSQVHFACCNWCHTGRWIGSYGGKAIMSDTHQMLIPN